MEEPATEQRLIRIQAWSGMLFALFLAVHLGNQAIAALGASAYDRTQRVLRRGYQSGPVEIFLVLGPLFVHVAVGLLRVIRRRRRGVPAASSTRLRIQRGAAYVLAFFFVGHVVATRGASWFYGVYPEFRGVSFTLRWVPAYFWPYYAVFGAAGAVHLVLGLGPASRIAGLRLPWPSRTRTVAWVCSLAVASIVLGLLGFGGVLRENADPAQGAYAALLRRLGIAH